MPMSGQPPKLISMSSQPVAHSDPARAARIPAQALSLHPETHDDLFSRPGRDRSLISRAGDVFNGRRHHAHPTCRRVLVLDARCQRSTSTTTVR